MNTWSVQLATDAYDGPHYRKVIADRLVVEHGTLTFSDQCGVLVSLAPGMWVQVDRQA